MHDPESQFPRILALGSSVNSVAPCPLVTVASSLRPSLPNRDNVLDRRSTNVLYLPVLIGPKMPPVATHRGLHTNGRSVYETYDFGSCGNGDNGGFGGG